jgi:hypothetical protein
MSEKKNTPRARDWRGVDEEEAVRKLLQDAGPRPPLPEDDLASIKEAARAQWWVGYGDRAAARRRARFWIPLAAAVLLGAVGLVWWAEIRKPRTVAAPEVASIERLTGVVRWEANKEGAVELLPSSVGRRLRAGSELETEADTERQGRLALRMSGGASVRLDAGTQVRVASATMLELARGGVYVDTGGGEEVAVGTPAGLFQGIGTQFEVRAERNGAVSQLRVREGKVRLDRGDESVLTESGGELIVRGDGGLSRGQTAAYGPEWDWVLKTAPMLDIEGVKVRTFLDWLARETGWRVELADEETASLCDSIMLHGSIDHLTPAEAPSVVLSSCGLGHRVSGGTLVVFTPKK